MQGETHPLTLVTSVASLDIGQRIAPRASLLSSAAGEMLLCFDHFCMPLQYFLVFDCFDLHIMACSVCSDADILVMVLLLKLWN